MQRWGGLALLTGGRVLLAYYNQQLLRKVQGANAKTLLNEVRKQRLGDGVSFRLAKLDDAVARFQASLDLGPETFHRREECLSPAVADANPNEPRLRRRNVRHVQKVLILADDDTIVSAGVVPDCGIGCATEVDVTCWHSTPREARNRARAVGSWLSTRNFTRLGGQSGRLDGPRIQSRQRCLLFRGTNSRRGSHRSSLRSLAAQERP